MVSIAYNHGDYIEVVTYDRIGWEEDLAEMECDDDPTEILKAAGYMVIGEWTEGAVPEVTVESLL